MYYLVWNLNNERMAKAWETMATMAIQHVAVRCRRRDRVAYSLQNRYSIFPLQVYSRRVSPGNGFSSRMSNLAFASLQESETGCL